MAKISRRLSKTCKLIALESQEVDLLHVEHLDFLKVLEFGASKYAPNGYLHPDPVEAHFTHRDNSASMFRHLAESYNRLDADKETGLDPLLHLACRALMAYCRKKKGLAY